MPSGPHHENTPADAPGPPWEPPPQSAVMLDEAAIHIWRLPLDLPAQWLESARQMLTPEETRRADRFIRAEHGRRFTAARAALRVLLAGYLNAEPGDLRLAQNEYGKPYLAGDHENSRIHFNLSHSCELGLAGFCLGVPIGIDIEQDRPRPDMLKIAKRFFAPQEVDALLAVEPEFQQQAFYTCWTRKEAYIKARGEGLHRSLKRFQVSLAPGDPPALLHTDDPPEESGQWTLYELDPGAGYTAALAAQGSPRQIRCWVFQS